jgi:hypothetical protein
MKGGREIGFFLFCKICNNDESDFHFAKLLHPVKFLNTNTFGFNFNLNSFKVMQNEPVSPVKSLI